MNREITVKFLKDEWLTTTRDGRDYLLRYSLVDSNFVGKPDEAFHTQSGYIIVGISGTLSSMWDINTNDLRKALFEYGKRHIETMISEGVITDRTELQMTTVNSPKKCPFDTKRIDLAFNKAFKFLGPPVNPIADASPSSLAFQIVDLRDSINAIFGERFGTRLLTLPQERHLVELFKSCSSHEEFAYRVASLGGLTTAMNTNPLKKFALEEKTKIKEGNTNQEGDSKELKSIDLLGAFLRNQHAEGEVNLVMDTLQGFNRLRRMYPIHTDRAKGVLAAHQFFGIDYPVTNHQKAWENLLQKYRSILELLLQILKANGND